MGCWNKTCGVSNLHIHAGDPVYVFILEGNTVGSNHCYSNHFYNTVMIPFHSFYDDYGSGENSSGIGLEVIIKNLKEKLIEKEVGENQFHDIAVKREEFDVDMLFESMRKGRLEIPNHYAGYTGNSKTVPVDFVMMRKDVVDKLIEEYELEEYNNGEYVHYKFTTVLDGVDELVQAIQDKLNEPDFSHYYFDVVGANVLNPENRIKHWIRFWTGFEFRSFINPFTELVTLVQENRIEDAKQFATDALKGAFMVKFMEMTRRSWIPQCGEGSQNTELAGHKLLAQTILAIAEKEEKEFDDYDDEDT
jgi:hypothetical protein